MRNLQDTVADKIREIDKFINTSPIIYKGFNLKELLVVEKYLDFKRNFLKRNLNKVREVIIDFLPRTNQLTEKTNYSSKKIFKYFFCFPYEINLVHFSNILLNIINEIKDKSEILVITNAKSTYNYFNRDNIACHLLFQLKFPYFSIKSSEKFNVTEKVHLENGKLLLDFAERIFDQTKPNVLLTAGDSDSFSQCFAKIARQKAILSITHQHGLISHFPLSMGKYFFSDYMIVWGNDSKKALSQYLDPNKLVILGTDKFNYLKDVNSDVEKNIITLAITNIPILPNYKKTTIDFLVNVLNELERIYAYINNFTLVIKLHPWMNESEAKKTIKKILVGYSFNNNYLVIGKSDNAKLLNKSKFLIYDESTISLEAQICDCSIIQVYLLETEKAPGKFFIADLHRELKKRVADNEYNDSILKNQRQDLKNYIVDFDSSKAEIEFIDSLI